MRDGINLANLGIPAVALVTEEGRLIVQAGRSVAPDGALPEVHRVQALEGRLRVRLRPPRAPVHEIAPAPAE